MDGSSTSLEVTTNAQLIGGTSHATNGYHKFPDGTIIQWGEYMSSSYAFDASITFPIAFPTACLSVVSCIYRPSGSNADSNFSGVKSFSVTGAVIGHDPNALWFAIGY